VYLPTALVAGWAHQLRGSGEEARAAFESALVLLDSVDALSPDDHRLHAARGLTLVGLGRHEEARHEADWLEHSAAYRHDAWDGMHAAVHRARILAHTTDVDAALAEIERLLTRPAPLSTHELHIDPLWDPLRGNPRFQALIEKYGN
jgi:hypothetical protein